MPSTWSKIKEIHRSTTAGAKEGFAFRYFSRPLASFILYFIKGGRITPNQVTVAALVVAVIGSVVQMTVLSYAGLLLGCALFMLAHVLDALDGQLARYRKAGSAVGMYFDFFVDEMKAYMMFVALGLRLYWTQDVHVMWFLGRAGIEDPVAILYLIVFGLLALATGISCTQFMKRPEWKEAFPATATEGTDGPPLSTRLVALVEKVGHFVVDYPSYIVFVCVVNRVDLYFLTYGFVVAVYAVRALSAISWRLCRINPY